MGYPRTQSSEALKGKHFGWNRRKTRRRHSREIKALKDKVVGKYDSFPVNGLLSHFEVILKSV